MRAFLSAALLGVLFGGVAAGTSSAHATPPCIDYVEIHARLAHVRSTVDGVPTDAVVPSEDVVLVRRQAAYDMVGEGGGELFRFHVFAGPL